MADFNTIKTTIDANINTNGNQEITGAVMNSVLKQMVDSTDEQLTKLSNKIDGLPIGDKFDSNGRYPSMTVGYSDNLVGRGESTPEIFSFRASGGRSINDGAARIKTLRGNTIVLNQHLPNNGNWRVQDGTLTMENNAYVVTPMGGYPGIATSLQSAIPVGNKIAVIYDYYTQGAGDTYVNIGGNNSRISNVEQGAWKTIVHIIPCEKWNEAVGCVVFGSGAASVIKFKDIRCYDFTRMFGQGNEPTTIEKFNAMLPLNVDLNAYNEGEVIPFNAEAIKSVGDNAWDEDWENGTFDTITGVNISNSQVRSKDYIKVLPDTEYHITQPSELMSDGMWIILYDCDKKVIEGYIGSAEPNGNSFKVAANTNGLFKTAPNARYMRFYMPSGYGSVYKNDIAISLYHSGWKAENAKYQPYKEFIRTIDTRILYLFPNGMHKWDKAYNKNGKGYVVKGTGVVDLGTCNWEKSTSSGVFYFEVSSSVIKDASYSNNLLCERYATWGGEKTFASLPNKSLMLYNGASYPLLGIKDSAYTDATSFKAAMQGVMLYYELAEPQVYEFAEPFNLDYEVADFGTEEIIASKPSAPISADIIYQFNAVDTIRDNQAEIEKIKAALAKAGITIDL